MNQMVRTGAEQLLGGGGAELAGQRVGVLSNHTAVLPDLTHLVDALAGSGRVEITAAFGAEHGFRGASQAERDQVSFVDAKTGLPVYNLYRESYRRQAQILTDASVDTILFDIQDVGVRFYTYIWSMYEAMLAAALTGKRFVVLDRPNPIGGVRIAGPMMHLSAEEDPRAWFRQTCLQHGMTVGELAQYFNHELLPARIGSGVEDLTVMPMTGWERAMTFDQTGLGTWVMPSPNLPSLATALAYPGTGLFEGTNLSEGRGTTRPFELIGAPFLDHRWAEALNDQHLPGVIFRDAYFTPTFSAFEGQECQGVQIHITDAGAFDALQCAVAMMVTARAGYPEFEMDRRLDRHSGSKQMRPSIEAGAGVADIIGQWQGELEEFDATRRQYLLYS